MPFLARLVLSASAAVSCAAHAQVYRCTDADGRRLYTSVPADMQGRDCTIVVPSQVSTVPTNPPVAAPAARSASPAGKADTQRVDPNTQRARDNSRRKILEDELTQEQRSLEKAKSDLAAQEQIRNADERNYQRVLDRLKPYQDAVERHERNISALQKELSNVR